MRGVACPPVHILLTHGLYAPQVYGGSERSLQHLAEALAALGRRVSVVVQGPPRLPEREAMNGVGVARIRQRFPWSLPPPQESSPASWSGPVLPFFAPQCPMSAPRNSACSSCSQKDCKRNLGRQRCAVPAPPCPLR
ncbi:MAG TPA: hypothetical protein DDX54_02320 [Rhodospirillaceae bacterium]|nr:hypothetical protein [Rhodospirillaceae bacterium]